MSEPTTNPCNVVNICNKYFMQEILKLAGTDDEDDMKDPMEELDVWPTTLEEKRKAIEKVSSKTILRFKFSWQYRYYGRPLCY